MDLVLVAETAQAYLEKKGEGFSLAFHDDTFEELTPPFTAMLPPGHAGS